MRGGYLRWDPVGYLKPIKQCGVQGASYLPGSGGAETLPGPHVPASAGSPRPLPRTLPLTAPKLSEGCGEDEERDREHSHPRLLGLLPQGPVSLGPAAELPLSSPTNASGSERNMEETGPRVTRAPSLVLFYSQEQVKRSIVPCVAPCSRVPGLPQAPRARPAARSVLLLSKDIADFL